MLCAVVTCCGLDMLCAVFASVLDGFQLLGSIFRLGRHHISTAVRLQTGFGFALKDLSAITVRHLAYAQHLRVLTWRFLGNFTPATPVRVIPGTLSFVLSAHSFPYVASQQGNVVVSLARRCVCSWALEPPVGQRGWP